MDCSVVPDVEMDASEDSDCSGEAPLDNFKTIQTFFTETAKISSQIPYSETNFESLSIFSTLRPYQRETVHWMIDKECNHKNVQIGPWNIAMPSGGILADEMGLGKTVELLACILGHPKEKEPIDPSSCHIDASISSASSNSPQKRKSTSVPTFLKKKPRLSDIKQNPVLKKGIECLLHDYFSQFKNKVLNKKTNMLSEKSRDEVEILFKIILLNRFFSHVTDNYIKNQVWGYLISEFEVDRNDSIGYSVLLEDSKEKGEPGSTSPKNDKLNNNDSTEMLSSVNEFFSNSLLKRFEKEFRSRLVYSLAVASSLSIPLLERDDVRCRCGSNKVFGDKIACTKCGLSQHLKCVGLTDDDDLNDYKCPICWMKEPPIESAATLIMVPPSLAVQWQKEIIKHAGDANLKVFLYEGVKKNYLLPPLMARFDIVLVTFATLRSEISFITNETRSLRHMKRYNSFITPLTCINWWRACIDEAQIVETVNQVSKMTDHLKYVHSWAVTGTPIEKSLHDLYGLTTFLRIEQFVNSYKSWNMLVTKDQTLLHELFAHLMRRKTKTEVSDQLALPQLTTSTIWLSFPPVEGYFYKSTHSTSMKTFLQKLSCIENVDQPLKKANPRAVSTLLQPLLSLRQACVCPFIVNSAISKFNLTKKSTMRELLPKMTKKTKNDCEDALRLYVMFVNGAAAIHMGTRNFGEAVTLYRNVLNKMKGFESLSSDSFQMIHVMHNLLEAASEEPTIELSDDEKEYSVRIEELEKKLLGKKQELVEARQQQLNKFSTEMENALNGTKLNEFSWWSTIITAFNFDDILPRIREALETRNIELTNAWKMKLQTSHRLSESLKYWLSDITEKRSITMLFMNQITNYDKLEALWNAAENCHIRKPEPRRSCLFCRMENVMLKYEALIFNTGANEDYRNGDANFNPIDWKMSASECILHVLVSLYRSASGQNSDTVNANNQLLAVEVLKKEFKQIRAVWSRQSDLVHVYDEIRMAKSIYDITAENALEEGENLITEHKLLDYEMKSESAFEALQSKYGSLQYLKNLEKKYENPDDIEESCPVCQNAIDETRAVLICGHFTCYGCMQSLVEHGRFHDRIQCPMCRVDTNVASITHVYGGGTSDYDVSHVKGTFSIKIRAITAKIMDLVREDSDVKILLFSTWKKVLATMESALKENGISRISFSNSSSLTTFKTKKNMNVLLLLLRSGSKGLNITEASHVIFVEPALHLSDENQAIGRIYRLGQSKNMIVHKFIIKSSVEHQIHRMNEEMRGDSGETEITFRHLRDLFDKSFGK